MQETHTYQQAVGLHKIYFSYFISQYGIHVLVAPDVRRWGSVAAPADFVDNPIAPRKALAAPTM